MLVMGILYYPTQTQELVGNVVKKFGDVAEDRAEDYIRDRIDEAKDDAALTPENKSEKT